METRAAPAAAAATAVQPQAQAAVSRTVSTKLMCGSRRAAVTRQDATCTATAHPPRLSGHLRPPPLHHRPHPFTHSQGLGATLLRNTPANAVYLGTFEVLKRAAAERLNTTPANLPAWVVLSSAGLGGICYWVVIFPVDCIKSAMQTDSIIRSQRRYTDIPTTVRVSG